MLTLTDGNRGVVASFLFVECKQNQGRRLAQAGLDCFLVSHSFARLEAVDRGDGVAICERAPTPRYQTTTPRSNW